MHICKQTFMYRALPQVHQNSCVTVVVFPVLTPNTVLAARQHTNCCSNVTTVTQKHHTVNRSKRQRQQHIYTEICWPANKQLCPGLYHKLISTAGLRQSGFQCSPQTQYLQHASKRTVAVMSQQWHRNITHWTVANDSVSNINTQKNADQ